MDHLDNPKPLGTYPLRKARKQILERICFRYEPNGMFKEIVSELLYCKHKCQVYLFYAMFE